VVSGASGDYSASELRAFVYAACHLSGTREIKDLSLAESLGINNPLARVTLIKTDGAEVRLSILSRNAVTGEYYLFSEDHQAIYMIPASSAEIFLESERAFMPRSVFPAVDSGELDSVSALSVDFFGSKGRDYVVERRGGAFFITSPILRRVPSNEVIETLLRPLSSFRGEPPDVASGDVGGDWDMRISMAFGGVEHAATIAERGGRIFMRDERTGQLLSSEARSRPAFFGDYASMMGSRAVYYPAGDVSRVYASFGGESFSSDRGDSWGGPDRARALSVLNALNGLEITSEVMGSPHAESDIPKAPESSSLGVTLTLSSGEIEEIALAPAGDGSYLVVVNGAANFATSASAFGRLRDAILSRGASDAP
jgi:hypothetical protein